MLYLLGSFCGVVISHKAMLDRHTGLCKGFGFLMYATPDMATTAIEWLNSHCFSASFAKVSHPPSPLSRLVDR
jgi:RNA recognition motif-containing protein